VNVLGIETSCDETSAAVVRDARHVLSNVVFSQAHLHRPYGGVVPEIASRSHVETLPGVVEEALRGGGLAWGDVDAVAVTHGPGLASSLLVGLSMAKGLALSLGKPLCAINHIEAHIYSVFLTPGVPPVEELCPFAALVVSGGHTCLVRVDGLGRYSLLGQTIDDAAGEAFDKGANLLGLGYPGGPLIDKASRGGDPTFVRFPRGRQRRGKSRFHGLDADLCFSFSGLKTALLYYLREHPVAQSPESLASVAASYQEAIADALAKRCERALPGMRALAVGGGVSLNRRLRERVAELAGKQRVRLLLAEPKYCADNAAMIAGLAGAGQGVWGEKALAIDAEPSLGLG
jgi:N6-L-threonylcarbamoyladenine synthase